MNRIIFFFIFLNFSLAGNAQKVQYTNLYQAYQQDELVVHNRQLQSFEEKNKKGVLLNEKEGEGVAWLNNVSFSRGIIELDLKGNDVFQKSFIGIAFHGINDSTYDAVYFRPFNFKTTDSVRRIHAVQYISHPQFTWKRLREERNAQFEKAIVPVPDPNEWFHAGIEVTGTEVLVFVNNASEPSLRVHKLNGNKSGRIGLWTGDGAGGAFANLVLINSNE